MRRSRDVRASVANLLLRNFGEFTMRNFRDTRTNVVRVSHNGRDSLAKTSRLTGEKIKLSATLARMSRDCRTNLNESRETLSRMSRDSRATIGDSHAIYFQN